MSKFKIEEVDDFGKWDHFVETSPQGTVFSTKNYLDGVGRKYKLFFIYKGQEVRAGLSAILTDGEQGIELDDLVIYNGIMFVGEEGQKRVNAVCEHFDITEFIIQELSTRFDKIGFSLSTAFEDLRPFLWHNYNSKNHRDKFVVDLRYTSYLDISEFFLRKPDTATLLHSNLDAKRQADLRKGNSTLIVEERADASLFIDMYQQTLAAQGVSVDLLKLKQLGNLILHLLGRGIAKQFNTKKGTGEYTYSGIFTIYKNFSHYLFGAGNIALMDRFDGTYCIWNAMKSLAVNDGIRLVDMEGVNSPNRGNFKLSFGGDMRPYYQVFKCTEGVK